MGGVAFSLANAAIRRDVWERLPAVPAVGLADRHWQRELQANGELILPEEEATVHWLRPLISAAAVRENCWLEGRAWRRLGVRYRLTDFGTTCDAKPEPRILGRGRCRPPESLTPDTELPSAATPALFAGNRLPCRCLSPLYCPTRPTSA